MRNLVFSLAFLAFAGLGLAQAPNAAGRQQFETRCAHCHGGDATGGEGGPNIIDQIDSRTQSELAAFLRTGRPASGMPAFDLPAQDMTALTAYVRTLVPVPSGDPPPEVRKKIQTTDGRTLEGRVLNEGINDLQMVTADRRIHLLRKAGNDRYREVTSQTDWATYHGDASGNRYTKLTQIDKSNVARLAPKWVFAVPNVQQVQNTPIVGGGIMYVSSANEVYALDAGTGRSVWHYQRARTKGLVGNASGGFNRGVAISGDRLFMLTDNAHIMSLNRFNGELLWETEMADWHQNYNGTSAPLVVGNLVITGTAGGDEGVRGFVAAYEAATGKEVWRFWTIPKPPEPGSETWKGNSWMHGAASTWMTGTYDPQLDMVYWPAGNPGPDFNGDNRDGDNLYSDSILALDVKTGKLKWYFQFTPHDIHDWDAEEPPVLIDSNWQGQPRKLLIQANRNGFFYVFDRATGQLLLAKPFIKKLTWAKEIGKDGRPVLNDIKEQANGESLVCPGIQGGTNWYSTSFNPGTGLYYIQALERCNYYSKRDLEWQAGKGYMAGVARPDPAETYVKSLRAINIQTGEIAWDLPQGAARFPGSGGVISTATGLVFFGENSGSFMAADAANGKVLWEFPANQGWHASPMTYMFDNKQYVAIASGLNIIAFALPE
jgi:alcohol dehydrogenase (cytochrome c)